LALGLAAAGCGAKTGLHVPEPDAGTDAGLDAGVDAGPPEPDAGTCPDVPVALVRREVETVFLLDRSGSMSLSWDGRPGGVGLPDRWSIVRDTLATVLPPYDGDLRIGAKLFPDGVDCELDRGLDVRPQRDGVAPLLELFDRFVPEGGTPAAPAIQAVLDDLDPGSPNPRVFVIAMDGGPNCNDDPGVPADVCVCTGVRRACLAPPPDGPQSCLDAERTLEVVRAANEERGTPVVVVGIDDPTRPDLSRFLDEMAVAGGLPRPAGADRRFYSARQPEDLAAAFEQIAELISRCVLSVPNPPPEGATVTVQVDGAPLPRDPTRAEGWDWTDEARGAMAFYGATCDALRDGDPMITAEVVCE
jgi:hypothetical protein